MASTILNEYEWNGDAIELKFAHYMKNAVRPFYNHAKLLGIRKNMMQWYARLSGFPHRWDWTARNVGSFKRGQDYLVRSCKIGIKN